MSPFLFRHKEEAHHPTGTLLSTLAGHTRPVNAIAWSPDGRLLASGSHDNTLRIWNSESFQSISTLAGEEEGMVWGVAWSPDGRLLAFGGFNTHLWDATHSEHLQPLIQRDRPSDEEVIVLSVAWSPDSRFLASGDEDATICLWDVIVGRKMATLKGHGQGNIWAVAWSPDGRLLASASQDQTVRLWEAHTGQTVAVLPVRPFIPQSVTWSPGGRLLASAGSPEPHIWDASTGQQRISHWKKGPESIWPVNGVAWSPDGRLLASASEDQTVGLWDVHKGRYLATLRGHTERVVAVAWSPNGRLLASASQDQTVRIWSVG
jgi:WD40 repeat protein